MQNKEKTITTTQNQTKQFAKQSKAKSKTTSKTKQNLVKQTAKLGKTTQDVKKRSAIKRKTTQKQAKSSKTKENSAQIHAKQIAKPSKIRPRHKTYTGHSPSSKNSDKTKQQSVFKTRGHLPADCPRQVLPPANMSGLPL